VWLARAQEASSFNTEDTENTEEGYEKGEKIWGMHGRAGADCFRRFDVAWFLRWDPSRRKLRAAQDDSRGCQSWLQLQLPVAFM